MWPGNYNRPQSLNAWNYVEANPLNYTDPMGHWRWQLTGGVNSFYHSWAEDWYEGFLGLNPIKQIEFTIPPASISRVDMFNAWWGDVYEVEPVYVPPFVGVVQAAGYAMELNWNSQFLLGLRYGIPYDWSNTFFHPGGGWPDWPGRLRVSMTGPYMGYDYVADFAMPGLVIYWLELNQQGRQMQQNGQLPRVTNKKLIRQQPPIPIPQPVGQQPIIQGWYCNWAMISDNGHIIWVQVWENLPDVLNLPDVNVALYPQGVFYFSPSVPRGFPMPVIDEGIDDPDPP
jgi:hypothetical protein